MKIINLLQGSDEWLVWRGEGITATDAVVLLDQSPYKTRWRLWAEKTGYARPVDLSMNPLVRNGIANEDKARQWFENKYDELLLPACVQSVKYPLLRASLDGLTSTNKPVELKCPSERVWNDVQDNGPESEAYQLYYVQVQHQLLVTGAEEGWLVFWFDGDALEFLIQRDDSVHWHILTEAKHFWKQVTSRKEPDKDPERDLYVPMGKQAEEWIDVADEYRAYDAEIQELKKRVKEIEAKQKPLLENVKQLMGEFFHADYAGLMVTRYKVAGKVNYQKLIEEKASISIDADVLDSYRAPASERCRVTVSECLKPRHIVDEEVLAPLEHVPEKIQTFHW